MTTDPEQMLRPELDLIRHAWQEQLVTHLQALKELRSAVRLGEQVAIDRVRRLAHRLHGTGGTLGVAEVADAAEVLASTAGENAAEALDQLILEVRAASVRRGGPGRVWLVCPDHPVRSAFASTLGEKATTIDLIDDVDAVRLRLDEGAPGVALAVISDRLPGDGARAAVALLHNADIPSVFLAQHAGQADVLLIGAREIIQELDVGAELLEAVAPLIGRQTQQRLQFTGDMVTGLADRAGIQRAANALADTDGAWTVALFRIIGAQVRDEALRDLGRALERHFGADLATCGRWSGEFLAVAAALGAEDFDTRVNAARMSLDGSYRVYIGAAIASGHDADTVIEAAEAAVGAAARGNMKVVNRLPKVRRTQVLVVDDDPALRAAVQAILRPIGVKVIPCSNGLDALRLTLERTFDIIFLDLVMAGGPDGLDVLAALRKRRSLADTPIVVLTSVHGDAQRIMAYERGADDYLTKPIRPAVLCARVQALLKRARPH
mgnify:CR=1 FL=1